MELEHSALWQVACSVACSLELATGNRYIIMWDCRGARTAEIVGHRVESVVNFWIVDCSEKLTPAIPGSSDIMLAVPDSAQTISFLTRDYLKATPESIVAKIVNTILGRREEFIIRR